MLPSSTSWPLPARATATATRRPTYSCPVRAREEEFTAFVRAHTGAVRRYARALTRDAWLADDVAQESFLRAWRYWPSCRDPAARGPWVMAICRNVAFDVLRQRQRIPLTSLPSDTGPRESGYVDARLGWVDTVAILGHLSLVHREVIVLIDVLGYDYRVTAEILDCPVGTVRSRINRARQALRALLAATHDQSRGA